MAQLASDNFTRANENPLANGVWTVEPTANGLQIVSNLCEASVVNGNSGSFYSGISWPADQYSEVTINSLNASGNILPQVRQSNTVRTGYELVLVGPTGTAQTHAIRKFNAGASAVLTTFSVAPAVNDVWRLSAVGSVLTVYQNGVQVATAPDSTIASGSAGLSISCGTAVTDAKVSLWAGGNFLNVYSVPDSRNYGTFPNLSRNVQGTLTYDVPRVFSLRWFFDTLFNRTQPQPLDSRAAGAPVDSRNSGNVPQNSRTFPPF
jgi:hypothetical protein